MKNQLIFACLLFLLSCAYAEDSKDAAQDINVVACIFIYLIELIIGAIALIVIICMGLKYLRSGNDPQSRSMAKNRIIASFTGLVIIVIAILIVNILGERFLGMVDCGYLPDMKTGSQPITPQPPTADQGNSEDADSGAMTLPGEEMSDAASKELRLAIKTKPEDVGGDLELQLVDGDEIIVNCDDDNKDGKVDNSDSVLDLEDIADFTRISINQDKGIPAGSKLFLHVEKRVQEKIRIFKMDQSLEYEAVIGPLKDKLSNEVEIDNVTSIYVEALEFPSKNFNGIVEIFLTLRKDGKDLSSKTVSLKVAPFYLMSNLDKANYVLVANWELGGVVTTHPLVNSLNNALGSHTIVIDDPEIWLQDQFEMAYTKTAKSHMNVYIDLPGPGNGSELKLLSLNNVGVYNAEDVYFPESSGIQDAGGDIEVTPPNSNNANGQIYVGINEKDISLLEAQKVQTPIIKLNTSWLATGHVDEMFSFVPASGSTRGYKVLVASPSLALKIFEGLKKKGKGQLSFKARSFGGKAQTQYYGEDKKVSIDEILSNDYFIAVNTKSQEMIEGNKAILKDSLSLDDSDFIEVPILYYGNYKDNSVWKVYAYSPNMVNLLVYNGQVFTAKNFGVEEDGKDVFEDDLRQKLGGIDLTVNFVDSWFYHTRLGGVHCATNTLRTPNT